MTLAEKIVRELRRKKDMGMTDEMLASALHVNASKVAVAAEALMEQEHLILGGDRCWYLGDAEAAGAAYVPAPAPESVPEVAPEPPLNTLEPTTNNAPFERNLEIPRVEIETEVAKFVERVGGSCLKNARAYLEEGFKSDPFGFQIEPPPAPKKPTIGVKTNQFGELPAWAHVKAWAEARPEDAEPISWTEFSKEIGIRKTTLGKARVSLLDRGETKMVAKLDRLVYREDSKSMRKRAGVEDVEDRKPLKTTWTTGQIVDDFEVLRTGLKKPTIPPWFGPLSDYLDLLQGFDDLCESQGLEPERLMRRRIAELMAWLREFSQ